MSLKIVGFTEQLPNNYLKLLKRSKIKIIEKLSKSTDCSADDFVNSIVTVYELFDNLV